MASNNSPDNGEAEREAQKAEQIRAAAEAEAKRLKAEQDLAIWKLREEWGGN